MVLPFRELACFYGQGSHFPPSGRTSPCLRSRESPSRAGTRVLHCIFLIVSFQQACMSQPAVVLGLSLSNGHGGRQWHPAVREPCGQNSGSLSERSRLTLGIPVPIRRINSIFTRKERKSIEIDVLSQIRFEVRRSRGRLRRIGSGRLRREFLRHLRCGKFLFWQCHRLGWKHMGGEWGQWNSRNGRR
jgi:hypothetical protein